MMSDQTSSCQPTLVHLASAPRAHTRQKSDAGDDEVWRGLLIGCSATCKTSEPMEEAHRLTQHLMHHSKEDIADTLASLPVAVQNKLVRAFKRRTRKTPRETLALWHPATPAIKFGHERYILPGHPDRHQLRLTRRPFRERDFFDEDREYQIPTPVFGPCTMRQTRLTYRPWSQRRSELVEKLPVGIDAAGRSTAVAEVLESPDLLGRIAFDCLGLRALIAVGSVCWTWLVMTRRIAKHMETLRWSKTYGRPYVQLIAKMINAEGTLQPDSSVNRECEPEELEPYEDIDGNQARAAQWIKERRVGAAAYCNPGEEPCDIFEDDTIGDFDGVVGALLATPSGALICSHASGFEHSSDNYIHNLSRLSPDGIVSEHVQLKGTGQGPFNAKRFSAMACDTQHLFLAAGRRGRRITGQEEGDIMDFTQIIKIDIGSLRPVAPHGPEAGEAAGAVLWCPSPAVTAHGMAVHGSKLYISFNRDATPDAMYDKLAVFDHSGAQIVLDRVITGSLARPRGMVLVGAELFVCDFGTLPSSNPHSGQWTTAVVSAS